MSSHLFPSRLNYLELLNRSDSLKKSISNYFFRYFSENFDFYIYNIKFFLYANLTKLKEGDANEIEKDKDI